MELLYFIILISSLLIIWTPLVYFVIWGLAIVPLILINYHYSNIHRTILNTQQNERKKKKNYNGIIIKLSPHTRCSPLMTNIIEPQHNNGTIILSEETFVELKPGFSFTLNQNNLKCKLGYCHDEHDTDMNAILIGKGTAYFSSQKSDQFSKNTENDEYAYLEVDSFITLPAGTVFNDGNYVMKFVNDTLIKVG